MATQTFDRPKTAELCGNCGRHLTRVGPNGECLRCLANFGCGEDDEPPPTPPATRQQSTPPSRYAHFELEIGTDGFPIELGAGAMAVTYRARDTVLNSVVALKVIDRTIAENPSARARFLREARAAAQIHHPNVARVTHYGEQDGECFYAMELVEGETLEARVRREGPMPLALALEVVQQAARALAAAEAIGVVHRDIKPSNVMIASEAGGSMLVKVIDYGVAKLTNLAAEPASDQTQSRFVGTPAFASPEQFAEPSPGSIGTPSDIYSLGVTFWYLLTGRTPFVGQTLEEVRARQAQPLPLDQLKNARVPPQVLALLRSMLALDPADRPQSARELLAAVHGCYVRFEPHARRRRKRLLAGFAVAALLLTAALAGTWFYGKVRADTQMDRAIAVMPFDNLSVSPEDEFLAIGIQDQILTKLASLADLKVIARSSTDPYKGKSTDLKTVGQQLGVGRVLEGSVHRIADRVRVNVKLIDPRTNAHLWASTYDRKLDDVFAVESEVANSVAQRLNTRLLPDISTQPPPQSTAAYNAYLRGVGIEHARASDSSYKDAAAAYTEAVRLDPNFAIAWARLCLVQSFLYFNGVDRDTNSAVAVKEAADRAVALAPTLGEAWLAQGTYRYRVMRDYPGALQAYAEAQKHLPNSALVSEYLVYVSCRLGQWKEAEAHFWKAAELDPRNFRIWTTTAAQIFLPLGRFPEAQRAVDRAAELSPGDENTIATQAEIFQAQGRLDEAERELARLPRDSRSNYVINLRVYLALLRRDYTSAIALVEEATKDLKPGQPIGPPLLYALSIQGFCEQWSGQPEAARATFERIIQAIAPTGSVVIAPGRETRSYLALAYAGLGDRENALAQARQAVAEFESDVMVKPIAEVFLARIQAQLGETDAVIASLPRLLATPRGFTPADLHFSPFLDPIRHDPRFKEIIEKLALPAAR